MQPNWYGFGFHHGPNPLNPIYVEIFPLHLVLLLWIDGESKHEPVLKYFDHVSMVLARNI